jgi:hypothetical protein
MARLKPLRKLPRTIGGIKKRNKDNGGLFFDPEVLQYRFTRVHPKVHKGYFITSEGTLRDSREYTIRQCDAEGNITTVMDGYPSFTEALQDLKTL